MATLLLVIIYIAFISLGLPDGLLGVAWPIVYTEFGVPIGAAGLVAMVGSAGTIVSSLLSGRVLSRYGTGAVTAVSVLMTAVALLGFALAPGFIWLVLLAVPLGLGAGSVDAGLNDFVAKNYEARHMNWLHSFWGIGAMTGPLIISQFIQRGGSWRGGYWTIATIQFVLVVALVAAIPVWEKVAATRRTEQKPGAVAPASEQPHVAGQRGLFSPLRIEGVAPVLIVFLFYCGAEATMGLWGSSFLTRVKGIDVATAATWISLYFGAITLGRLISGFISMRVSTRGLIRAGQAAMLAGALLLLLPLPNSAALAGIMLFGLGCAPIFPGMLHETPMRFGNQDAQNIMGFQMATAYTGTLLLPPLFGAIASATSFMLMPLFLIAYALLMLAGYQAANRLLARKHTRLALQSAPVKP